MMFSFGRLVPRLLNIGNRLTPSISSDPTRPTTALGLLKPNRYITSCQTNLCIQTWHIRTMHAQQPMLPQYTPSLMIYQIKRDFHKSNSKIEYLDFRHRFRTNGKKLHMLIIRRQKMKKHRRDKFRKKFKALLQKQRLKREISKEKAFRVELLSMIRLAEKFDPKEYALKRIQEINSQPKPKSKKEMYEELKEKIRVNRYQTDYVKPKHRRAEI